MLYAILAVFIVYVLVTLGARWLDSLAECDKQKDD